jgi:hypothetical protein
MATWLIAQVIGELDRAQEEPVGKPEVPDGTPEVHDGTPEVLDGTPEVLDVLPEVLDVLPEVLDGTQMLKDRGISLFWLLLLQDVHGN